MSIDYMYQERREEEDLPELKTALTYRYIEKLEQGLITDIRNDTESRMANRMTITGKQKWEEKQV